MRYLHRPSASEELLVRGRYEIADAGGRVVGHEAWERYRYGGTAGQAWRSEWQTERDGQLVRRLSHAVVGPDGLARLKLRGYAARGDARTLTLTPEGGGIVASQASEWDEIVLPPGYGVAVGLPSLARFAFPIDLASEQPAQATLLAVRWRGDRFALHPTAATYVPLGLRDVTLKGQTLRAKGWQVEASDLPTQSTWFDRHGTALAWESNGVQATLVEWTTFG